MTLLEVKDVKGRFRTKRGVLHALNGVSFSVNAGEILGLVGESGSGKTVSQMSYMGLLPTPPFEVLGGQVLFKGEDLLSISKKARRGLIGDRISMIFQEPMTALNPYMTVGDQLTEPLRIHHRMKSQDAKIEITKLLDRVGIPAHREILECYPHELSGGMRQRVMIAMALSTKPDLLIADEPTTALDATVQAQILELIRDLQKETGMGVIFITHDLGVIAGIAHRVAVMYAGKIIEQAQTPDLFVNARHPYTFSLLKATPRLDKDQKTLTAITGQPPNLVSLTNGCQFVERCDYRLDRCRVEFPKAHRFGVSHESYCHVEDFAR